LRSLLKNIDEEARELNRKTRPVKYRAHIGNAYFVAVSSGYMCVDFRKYFLPYGMEEGNEKPTRHGVSLRLEEWSSFLSLIPVIESSFPALRKASPCYANEDHLGQQGYFACSTCNPFYSVNYAPL